MSKTESEFDWKAEYSLQEGLNSVYKYAKEASII